MHTFRFRYILKPRTKIYCKYLHFLWESAMTIEGYFDGKTFVPLEKLSLKPNQKVQITVLDEFLTSEKQKQISRKHGKDDNKK